jgi:fibronectin type 3 domain-containing protein
MRKFVTLQIIALLLGVITVPGRAFIHPCIPATLEDLDTIKANLDKEPWKSGYAALAADGKSQLTYQPAIPVEVVKRNPNENLWQWRGDMIAFYNLARMWYFTKNEAYAKKAHDIIIGWAITQKVFGGQESGLDLGDYAICYGGGASILRGTWPGWTQQDTVTVQNYFRNVLWPATAAPINVSGPANKGSLNLVAGAVIAVFCDDTEMFNHVVDVFRNYPGSGLPNILPTGQMGETGRDWGHCFNDLSARVLTAEILWKQGIDVYSELDNRLLAAGEYHARNTSSFDTPFVPYGTVDYTYYANAGGLNSQDRGVYYMLQNAYKNRLGLPTPWIDRKLQEQGVHGGNFMAARTADFSKATPPSPDPRPAVSLASSGLTLTTLGTQTAGRSVSYANGVWTMTGLGNGCWSDVSDDCQFAYQAMTGDCAMVARVTSSQQQAGLMIRDNLTAAVSQRMWIAILSSTTPNKVESRSTGWTATWGGSNWARRSQDLPPGLPYWLKIERKGTVITSYSSQDGTSWSPIISSDFANLPATVYVGMLTSRPTTANTATFDHVAFTGGTGGLVTTPAAPAALLASGFCKGITLRWLPSFGATGYDVLRSITSGGGYTVIASNLTTARTSYVDTSAAADTTYYYVVRAKNAAGTSGDSPEFSSAVLPAPLVNLPFSGGTAKDNDNSAATNSASAFDDSFGSFWFHGGTTGWLQYDFGANSAQVIKRYTMVSAPLIPERDPKDWQFQGSNDGSTWTTLDTQSNQTFQFRTYLRIFDIGNTTAYRYYRLNVTANNGDASFLHLSSLGLWGDSGRTVPDGSYVLASRNTNKVLDLASGNTANGTAVVQSAWKANDSQRWQLAWQGNGLYRATNVASSKVLDNGGSSTAGGNLVIQPSSTSTSQLWKMTSEGDGFFRIESASSALVADVKNASSADGANVVQSTYSGGASQQWMAGVAVSPQPIPPAPTGLAGSAVSINQINLSWTASPGAIGYRIKRATVSGGPYTAVTTEVNTTSYSDANLDSSTTYYYVVSAVNGSGESANSAQIGVKTLTGAPLAPTGLTAILGTHRVTLSWSPAKAAKSYVVKRASASGGPYTTVATGLTGTTYTDTSVTHSAAIYYVVAAVNADGTSPDSAEVAVGAGTLVAHLKFDESNGTLATDSSGRAQNATLVNGASFAPGILENGLNLPATASQYASLPSGIVSGLTDFTIATWIKVKAFATWQRIFDFGSGGGTTMFLAAQGPAGAGRLRFSIRTSTVAEQNIDSTVALTTGVWTHVAVIRSGNTVSLYINGSLAGFGTTTLSPVDMGFTTQNYLGKSQFVDPYLNATLDDFRIYAHAMSPAELTALANPPAGAPTQLVAAPGNAQVVLTWVPNGTTTYTIKRATTSGGPYTTIATGVTDLTYTDTGVTNGVTYYYIVSGANAGASSPDSTEVAATPNALYLHLKFNETSGAVAADSSGNARNATLVNGPVFAPGKADNALAFTAASSQYASVPASSVQGLTRVTIMAWVKPTTVAQFSRIFDFGVNTTSYMFLSPNVGNVLRFAITNSGSGNEQRISGTATLPLGVWSHVAVTLDGSVGRLYLNGIQVGVNSAMTLTPASLGTLANLYLGRSQFSADPYLNGAIDDFRIYGGTLDPSEIQSLATDQPGVPQNVTATSGIAQISLAWDAVPQATGYVIKRSTTSGGTYTTIAQVATPGYVDTGLQNAATWYYTVFAQRDSAEGAASSPVSATTYTALEGWRLSAFGSIVSNSNNTLAKPDATQDVAYAGQTLAVGATGSSLTYSKVSGPAWLSVASNGALSGTPRNADVGTNTFLVRATDAGSGASDDVSLEIEVANVNDAPTWNANSIPLRQVSVGWAYAGQTLTGKASDIDAPYGDSLTFSKVSGPAWLSVASNGTLSGTPGANDVGTNTFTMRIKDSGGLSADATVTIPVAAVGLRSRYDFEASLADAVSGFNGTATGAPTYARGRLGVGALTLDGTTSSVRLPVNAASYEEITVAAFVYWNGGNQWQRIFDFGTGTTSYLYLTPRSGSNTTQCAIRLNNGTEYKVGAPQLASGQWVHLAVTLSANSLKLYVNGALAGATNSVPVRPVDIDPTVNYLGKSQFAADPLFNGRIDDLRIYNKALTATEVLDLATPVPETPSGLVASRTQSNVALTWNAAEGAGSYTVKRSLNPGGPYTTIASGLATPNFTDPNVSSLITYYYVVSATNTKGESPNSAEATTAVSDLVLHLRFDESSGTTAADTSGNGRNATLVSGPTFAAGKLGNALGFVKASSQYATLPAELVSSLTDFTISTWVNPTTLDTWARVFDFGTGTTNYLFLSTTKGAGKPRVAFKVNGAAEQGVDSSVALTAGAWSHVAVTLSGNTMTLYVNGAVAGTNTNVTARPSQLGSTTLNYLGKSQFNDPYLNGALDDFRIYNRALSASEIGVLSAAQITVPQNVTATPGDGRITLAWNAVSGATAYTVQRSSSASGPFTVLARGITAATYADTGLADATTWYYTVAAEGLPGESAASATVSATTFTLLEKWRFANFGTASNTGSAADGADPDGDGLTNAQEYNAGTDPKSAASVLKINQVQPSGSNLVVSFATVAGKTYSVERSDTLQSGSWTAVQSGIAGTGSTVQVTDANAATKPRRFYRIIAQ